MADETEWYTEVSLPALLRAARAAYGKAIRAALAEAGCDDVPPNGSYVIGAIARTGAALGSTSALRSLHSTVLAEPCSPEIASSG